MIFTGTAGYSYIARMIAGEIIPRAPLLQQIRKPGRGYQEYCRAGFRLSGKMAAV